MCEPPADRDDIEGIQALYGDLRVGGDGGRQPSTARTTPRPAVQPRTAAGTNPLCTGKLDTMVGPLRRWTDQQCYLLQVTRKDGVTFAFYGDKAFFNDHKLYFCNLTLQPACDI